MGDMVTRGPTCHPLLATATERDGRAERERGEREERAREGAETYKMYLSFGYNMCMMWITFTEAEIKNVDKNLEIV